MEKGAKAIWNENWRLYPLGKGKIKYQQNMQMQACKADYSVFHVLYISFPLFWEHIVLLLLNIFFPINS